MAPSLKKLISLILDLVFPKICSRCGGEGHYLCSETQPSKPLVEFFSARKRGWYLDGIIAAYSYTNEPVRQAIHRMKYNRIPELATVLGQELKNQAGGLFDLSGIVVPVPLHRKRLAERGFNQAALIATQLPFSLIEALIRTRSTSPQIDLKRPQRRLNMIDAFGPSPAINEVTRKTVFVVDDVATTGATLNACAKVLKAHGAAHVFGLVVARD